MKLTLGTTYYNCPNLLINFLEHHRKYFDEIIVVDDGSSDPAEKHIQDRTNIKLYRIPIDYGFNSHGCRNLIMKETTTDWTVLFDVDRLIVDPKFAIDTIKTKRLRDNTLYLFEMFSDYNRPETVHPSVNEFLIHKNHFWKAGGYDEEFIGMRTGDREYREQLKHFGKEQLLHGLHAKFVRGPSQALKVNSPKDIKIDRNVAALVKRRILKPDPNKPTLTFDWQRVF